MQVNKSELISSLKELNLPNNEYVVVGGGVLAALDLKETYDIDLVVSPVLFASLRQSGWKLKNRPNNKPGLRNSVFEAYLDVDCGEIRRSFDALIQDSFQVEGISFMDVKTLVLLKLEYGRPKDLVDLELLENVMSQ